MKTNTINKLLAAVAASSLAVVSANAVSLDLINNIDGSINGAYFTRTLSQSTGTGVINPFVRLQDDGIADGYNSSERPVMPDVNNSPQFTKDLLLSSVPLQIIGGIPYYEFLLDINQQGANPLLSLDKIDIYTSAAALTSAKNLGDLAGLTPRYSLDAGGDSEILLNYGLNNGSGSGDMLAYIPKSLFGQETDYVTFYSMFGAKGGAYEENDGFEEWAVKQRGPTTNVPDGGSMLVLLGGAVTVLGFLRRKISA